jgi:hypothetical protein
LNAAASCLGATFGRARAAETLGGGLCFDLCVGWAVAGLKECRSAVPEALLGLCRLGSDRRGTRCGSIRGCGLRALPAERNDLAALVVPNPSSVTDAASSPIVDRALVTRARRALKRRSTGHNR